MYGNYMDSNILGLEAVSLVERSNIQCPFLGVSFIRGSTVRGRVGETTNYFWLIGDFVLSSIGVCNFTQK